MSNSNFQSKSQLNFQSNNSQSSSQNLQASYKNSKYGWNLTSLFMSDSDPLIEMEKENLQKTADQFTAKWEARTDWLENAESLLQILEDCDNWHKTCGTYGKVGFYFFLRTSQDSQNPELKAAQNKIDEISTKIGNKMQFVELRLAKIDKQKQQEFLRNLELSKFKHFLERIFQASSHLLTESEEKIVSLLSFHPEKWANMTEEFLSGETVDWDLKIETKNLENQKIAQNPSQNIGENSEIILDLSAEDLQKPRKKYVRAVIFEPKSRKFLFSYFGNVQKANKYGLIGGGIDENETEIKALKREIMEETDLENYEIIGKVGGSILSPRDEEFEKADIIKETVAYLVIAKNSNFISPKLSEREIQNGFELQWKNCQEVKIEKPYSEEQILLELGIAKLAEMGFEVEKKDIFVIYNQKTGLLTHRYNLESWKNYNSLLCFDDELELQKELEIENGDYQILPLESKFINYTNYRNVEYSPKILVITNQKKELQKNLEEILFWETQEKILEKFRKFFENSLGNYSKICLLTLQKGISKIAKLCLKKSENSDLKNQKEIADYFSAEELNPKSEVYRGGEFQVWEEIKKLNLNQKNQKNWENNLGNNWENQNLQSELLVATHNPSKVKRYQKELADLPVKIVSLAGLGLKVETPIEIGNSTLEIVKNKAKFYFDQTQMPCFSNDSGLFFEVVEEFEQPKTNVKGIAGITDEMNQEEIYKKMIEFYQNLATKYGGELKGYFLDSYALFDGKEFFVKEVKRPILLTNKVNQKDIHFPICSLYKVKDKFYHDLNEFEMSEFLAESVNGLKEIIENWQKTQNLNSKNLENNLENISQNQENQINLAKNLENCKNETKKLTFEELMTKMSDSDKATRDLAAVKFNQVLEKYKKVAEHELNAILQHKKVIDELRGYQSPDSARLCSDDIDPKTVKTLLESVQSKFEISQKYYELKAKLMGKEKLEYHERNVEYGKVVQNYTFDQGVEILKRVFAKLDNSGQNLGEKSDKRVENQKLENLQNQNYNLTWEKYQNIEIRIKNLDNKLKNSDDKLILRSLKISDAEEILAQNKGNIIEYFMEFKNLQNVQTWIVKVLEEVKNKQKLELVIEKNGKLVGILSLRNLQTKPEFGLWVGENWQKMGIAKNSMRAFIDWVWVNTTFEKLFYMGIDPQNIASLNLVKSIGATKIGEFDYVFCRNNGQRESSFLAILEDYLTNGKIDVFPRVGKRGGAFMTGSVGRIIDPTFIFLNWTGTLNDVQTFAHEMGHACNYEMMKTKILRNPNLTTFDWQSSHLTAESPSTFMEDFVLEDVLANITSKEEKLAILMKKLNDDISSIFRQISLYLFELELHEEFRKNGYLSSAEIGKLFGKHMANYMGDAVEMSEGSENWWIYWSHIRMMFYVYSYGAGLLISKFMQEKLSKNPEFITQIKNFYASEMSQTPIEILAQTLGIDTTKPEIWQTGLDKTAQTLEMAENLARELDLV